MTSSAHPTGSAALLRHARVGLGLPFLAAAAVAGAGLVLGHALEVQEQANLQRITAAAASSVKNEINARMEARVFALVRMARRLEIRRESDRREWEADAHLIAEHHPGTQAIVRVDADMTARWVAPPEGNEVIEGAALGLDERRRKNLEAVRQSGEPRMMRTFDLLEGHRGVFVVAPIGRGEHFAGYIAAIFRTQEMLNNVMANVAPGFGIAVADETDEIYYRPGVDRPLAGTPVSEGEVEFAGMQWRVRVWPAAEATRVLRSSLDEVALWGGVALALLVGVAVHLALTARLRARAVEAANRELEAEVVERQRAQEAFSHLAAIVDSSDDAIIGISTGGAIVSFNAGAERVYGYRADEVKGRPLRELQIPARSEELEKALQRIRSGESGEQLEAPAVRKDGREIHVSLTVSPIRNPEGTVVGVSAISRDITRRKRAQLELENALAQVEQSAQDQTRSLAATSHDVRGALATIAGYGEVLAEECGEEGPRDMALRIVSLANTLADIMTDLLQYASGEKGTELSRRAVSARELVERCTHDFVFVCKEKGLGFRVDLPADGTITTDPTQVTRIMQNLLSNAVRYTKEGEVYVRGELNAEHLRLLVRDTGIGIPAGELDRVFEEFYRTDTAKQMERLGTGLGLATVRRLARLLGGDVHVESEVGVGTTFEILLPREANA